MLLTGYVDHIRYVISVILFRRLIQVVDLLPPSIKNLKFSRFLKNGNDFLYSCTTSKQDLKTNASF